MRLVGVAMTVRVLFLLVTIGTCSLVTVVSDDGIMLKLMRSSNASLLYRDTTTAVTDTHFFVSSGENIAAWCEPTLHIRNNIIVCILRHAVTQGFI